MSDLSAGRTTTGYSAWRLIAEELRAEITEGRLRVGDRLPAEIALAERFSVHRHTARQALAALADEGLVEPRRGSGTFVTGAPMHVHQIGVRTRLSTSLGEGHVANGRVLESATESAGDEVAARLGLEPGDPVVRVETLRTVDDAPFALSTRWFDGARLPDSAEALRGGGSVTASLRANGIDDYVRVSTVIASRHATSAERSLLELEPGAIVLVSEALDALPDGTPLQHLVTRFDARRVRLRVEHPDPTEALS